MAELRVDGFSLIELASLCDDVPQHELADNLILSPVHAVWHMLFLEDSVFDRNGVLRNQEKDVSFQSSISGLSCDLATGPVRDKPNRAVPGSRLNMRQGTSNYWGVSPFYVRCYKPCYRHMVIQIIAILDFRLKRVRDHRAD